MGVCTTNESYQTVPPLFKMFLIRSHLGGFFTSQNPVVFERKF